MTIQDSVNKYLQASIANNWEHMALTDFQGASYQYRDVARKVAKLHLLYGQAGIKPGDKVALCGKNSSQWAIALIATLTYGAVAVPILHDFKPDNIQHLVSHSESRLLFVDTAIWENLDPESMAGLQGAIQLSDFSLLFSRSDSLSEARRTLNQLFGERYPERFTPADVKYHIPEPDALMLINYTSGSTGFSKGVMITQRNLWSNLQFCIDHLHFLNPGDGIVCMLPLAHMYGLVADFLHTFIKGCHIYFLTRTPSPKIIMDAFAMVRPKMIITVPLIIEKIIKTKVFPLLDKPMMKLLMHVPFVDDHLLGKIKERLEQTFGGQLQQMIIGGAGLSKDVETFLRRIRFPFTVGYGMTECAPLIAYAPGDDQRPGSCGRVVDRMG
ncbi:MAG: AMP-binding protein, partial [Muribaculaceae bacterium]|nr:AMP-binding protein [Muribaculaceae bacterium]